MKKWHNYLQGRHFIIRIDHHSLNYFPSQRANNQFQQKWVAKLMGFDYEIHYKKAIENLVADALSRLQLPLPSETSLEPENHSSALCYSINYPYFGWLDELRRFNETNEWILQKKQEVITPTSSASSTSQASHNHIDNGLRKYKSRIVINPYSHWKSKLLVEHHSTPAVGHQRVHKTYQRLKKEFY